MICQLGAQLPFSPLRLPLVNTGTLAFLSWLSYLVTVPSGVGPYPPLLLSPSFSEGLLAGFGLFSWRSLPTQHHPHTSGRMGKGTEWKRFCLFWPPGGASTCYVVPAAQVSLAGSQVPGSRSRSTAGGEERQ